MFNSPQYEHATHAEAMRFHEVPSALLENSIIIKGLLEQLEGATKEDIHNAPLESLETIYSDPEHILALLRRDRVIVTRIPPKVTHFIALTDKQGNILPDLLVTIESEPYYNAKAWSTTSVVGVSDRYYSPQRYLDTFIAPKKPQPTEPIAVKPEPPKPAFTPKKIVITRDPVIVNPFIENPALDPEIIKNSNLLQLRESMPQLITASPNDLSKKPDSTPKQKKKSPPKPTKKLTGAKSDPVLIQPNVKPAPAEEDWLYTTATPIPQLSNAGSYLYIKGIADLYKGRWCSAGDVKPLHLLSSYYQTEADLIGRLEDTKVFRRPHGAYHIHHIHLLLDERCIAYGDLAVFIMHTEPVPLEFSKSSRVYQLQVYMPAYRYFKTIRYKPQVQTATMKARIGW